MAVGVSVDLPERVNVKYPPRLRVDEQNLEWKSAHYPSLSVTYKDSLWRLAAGCLKSGKVLSRWNTPAVNFICACCDSELETVPHLFMTCTALKSARDLVLSTAHQWLGLVIDPRDEL